MTDIVASINIGRFPVHAVNSLQRSIQHFYDMVAVSLRVTGEAEEADLVLPGSFLHLNLTEDEQKTFEKVREELLVWTLRCGMRDSLEALSNFLEDIREQCDLIGAVLSKPDGIIKGEEYNDLRKAVKKFHGKGLPEKLEILSKDFGVTASTDLQERILSLNKARNCLVHRAGRVQPKDIGEGQIALEVNWLEWKLFARSPRGLRELAMPDAHVEADEVIELSQAHPVKKTFELNQPVIFSAQEFSEICSTFHLFSRDIAGSAESFMKAKGYVFSS